MKEFKIPTISAWMTRKDAKKQFEDGYWRTLFEFDRVIYLPDHKHQLEIKKFLLQKPTDLILECKTCSARFFYDKRRVYKLVTDDRYIFDVTLVKKILLSEPFFDEGYYLRLGM